MKITILKNRLVSLLLVFTLTFQSCSIYKKTNVSLSEAEKANLKTLVVTDDNVKHKYTRIIKIDDNYYGETNTKGKTEQKLLSEDEIKSIRILDKTSSLIGNVVIVLVTFGTILLISTVNFAPDFNIDDSGY